MSNKYCVKLNSANPLQSEVYSPGGEKLSRIVNFKIEIDINTSAPVLHLTVVGVDIEQLKNEQAKPA